MKLEIKVPNDLEINVVPSIRRQTRLWLVWASDVRVQLDRIGPPGLKAFSCRLVVRTADCDEIVVQGRAADPTGAWEEAFSRLGRVVDGREHLPRNMSQTVDATLDH